ncbi:MAG TPA: hypothetical protein VJT71_13540 [Pyrinomonadaceae bacterium]|nr:hypothetical protein [Pyrinomonadaceae bacterium]
MSGRSLKLIALVLSITTAVIAGNITDDDTLQEISKYRQWSRVTQKVIALDYASVAG